MSAGTRDLATDVQFLSDLVWSGLEKKVKGKR
jgi:hypothetical protein